MKFMRFRKKKEPKLKIPAKKLDIFFFLKKMNIDRADHAHR